jgi:hypothetical protein
MFRLQSLLQRYARQPVTIKGGADDLQQPAQPAAPAAAPLNKEDFRRDLEGLMRTNTLSIVLVVIMIVVSFGATLVMIHQYATNASAVATLFVGFGALTAALTTAIFAMFKVKTHSDMLRILSKQLDSASLQTVIDIFAKRA